VEDTYAAYGNRVVLLFNTLLKYLRVADAGQTERNDVYFRKKRTSLTVFSKGGGGKKNPDGYKIIIYIIITDRRRRRDRLRPT